MSTRTGLKFIQLANGTVQAHYKTHSPSKVETIVEGLKERAYTVVNKVPLLHTREVLLVIPIAVHIPKANFGATCADFKTLWREMRAAQKAQAKSFFEEIEEDEDDLDA